MANGDDSLQGVLTALTEERTPKQAVQHLIDTYGKRQSATNPSVPRYGRHNGGVGSVNLMLMARELLADHLESPPTLRGEYLQRHDDESSEQHLDRVTRWFAKSIESGVPVILYFRRYERTRGTKSPRMVFGHHVVVTALEQNSSGTDRGGNAIAFTFADSASGRVDQGHLMIAEQVFTAPTFVYRFDGGRALTSETLRTGRPLLEARVPSYESRNSIKSEIMVAHFATFAQAESAPALDRPL